MTAEHNHIPDWARQERQGDLTWIRENLDLFWEMAATAYEEAGRGAIAVDTTTQLKRSGSHLFGYLLQTFLEQNGDEDTKRMVQEYDPQQEVVVLLLKSDDRSSTYRIQARQRQSAGEG